MGYFDPHGLQRALKRQAIERLLSAMSWASGSALFRCPVELPSHISLEDPSSSGSLDIDLSEIHLRGLHRLAERGLTAHRVVAAGELVVTRGDNAPADDDPVPREKVLGKVTAVIREGKRLSVGRIGLIGRIRRIGRSLLVLSVL